MVYIDRLPLTLLAENGQTSHKYYKLLDCKTGPLKILKVSNHFLSIDEIGIFNTIWIDMETFVAIQLAIVRLTTVQLGIPPKAYLLCEEMNLSLMKLFVTLKLRIYYSTKLASTVMGQTMIHISLCMTYQTTSLHDTGIIEDNSNDNHLT